MTVPAAAVYAPPLTEYWPPATEIDAAELIPATVMLLEAIVALRVTLVCALKANAFGVVSAASVVTVNAPLTPPIVSVAVVAVLKLAEEV